MNWKKLLLLGVGWGLGTAVGLAGIIGCFVLYQSRPKPPKPWNRTAIKAEFNFADTEGTKNSIFFIYTLENTTDFDYRIEDGKHADIHAMLEREHSLTGDDKSITLDYPISVPARKRVQCQIHIPDYTYPESKKPEADFAERNKYLAELSKYRAGLASYIAKELPNLDGFDLLDENNRYEIAFPSGWKNPKPQQ